MSKVFANANFKLPFTSCHSNVFLEKMKAEFPSYHVVWIFPPDAAPKVVVVTLNS